MPFAEEALPHPLARRLTQPRSQGAVVEQPAQRLRQSLRILPRHNYAAGLFAAPASQVARLAQALADKRAADAPAAEADEAAAAAQGTTVDAAADTAES